MPSLVDIFNPSFLMFLGIMVLVVALLVVYFESKMREQNHKITSMFSLVSSMADELNAVKYNVSVIASNNVVIAAPEVQNNTPFSQELKMTSKLIHVSDDEIEEDSDDSDDDASDSESGSGSESESDSEDDNMSEHDLESLALSDNGDENNEILDLDILIPNENIKVLKMEPSLLSSGSSGEQLFESIVLEELSDDHDNNDDDSSSSSSSSDDEEERITIEEIKENELKQEQDEGQGGRIEEEEETKENKNDMIDFKTISISNFEDIKMETDYKKMSIGRLRKIVQEKGLVEDSSKLKKNEILKLLGSSE